MDRTYPETLKKLHFDMHTTLFTPDVGKYLDPKAFADAIEVSGAQSVTFFAQSVYSFHQSKYGLFHPNATRDIFGEVTAELRKRHIDVTAYCAVTTMSKMEIENENLWNYVARHEDGSLCLKQGFFDTREIHYHTCPTSGYFKEKLIPFMVETAKKYDVNAFWLDGLYHYENEPCYCQRCREEFIKAYPEAHGDVHSRAFYKWREEQIWNLLNDVAQAVKKVNPKITVGSDVIGTIPWSVPFPKDVGFVTYDPQTPNLAFNNAMQLAAQCWRGIATDMNIQRMYRWANPMNRSLPTMLTEAAISMSMNSMFVLGDIINAQTIMPNIENMKVFRKVFDFGEKIHNKIKNGKAYADIAIISSPEQARRNNYKDWRVPFDYIEGAYETVLEDGLTTHILFDDDLKENLSRYKVAILPEIKYMTKIGADAVKDYVNNGGKLIITGCLPKVLNNRTDFNEQSEDKYYENMCGLKIIGNLHDDISYVDVKGSPAEKLWKNEIKQEVCITTPTTLVDLNGAKELSPLYYAGAMMQVRMIGEKTGHPAITKYNYGKGTVLFFAQSLFKEIYDTGSFAAKYLFQSIMNSELTPYAFLTGYSNAQLVISKENYKTYLNIIIYDNDLRERAPRSSCNPPCVAELCITVNDNRKIKCIESVMGGGFKFEKKDSKVIIKLDPVKIYEGIIITWENE